MYHNFPGGRSQIMAESVGLAGDTIGQLTERAATESSIAALRRFGECWAKTLADSNFSGGCPRWSLRPSRAL